MNNTAYNKPLVREALATLTANTGIIVHKLALPKAGAIDAAIQLTAGNKTLIFRLLLKNEIRQWQVPELLTQLNGTEPAWLLLCNYIPQPVKELLKKENINYLEAAGNCFIKKDGLFVYINDKKVTPHRQTATGKLWKPAGLRLVFTLLQNTALLNEPYRTIAQQAHIALGNIGQLLHELQEEGYIKNKKENNKNILYVERKAELQKKWVELFITLLRPKLTRGRFRFMTPADKARWKTPVLPNTCWGGEPAGALLTHYLEPERFTIYTTQPTTEIIKTWRLLPDKNGELEILEPFWHIAPGKKTVPPLLAYAELATSLDSRNRETAERIKQQYLENN
jgi:hypothetical protein